MNSYNTLVTEFDYRTTNGSTQLIKAIIPFLKPNEQKIVAIITRIGELIMTLKFFENNCFENDGAPLTSNLNPEMINHIKRYCTPESQQTIDMILKFMNMSELMNIMNMFGGEDSPADSGNIMDLFKNFNQFTSPFDNQKKTTGSANPFGASIDPSSLMQSMMNPEQSQLYQEFMAKLDSDFND